MKLTQWIIFISTVVRAFIYSGSMRFNLPQVWSSESKVSLQLWLNSSPYFLSLLRISLQSASDDSPSTLSEEAKPTFGGSLCWTINKLQALQKNSQTIFKQTQNVYSNKSVQSVKQRWGLHTSEVYAVNFLMRLNTVVRL